MHKQLIQRLHRMSAMVLLMFLVVHIANHLAAVAGIETHRAFMEAARIVYRSTLGETLVLAAVCVQVVSGTWQLRAVWGRNTCFWERLQVYSGSYLLFFLTVHTIAILSIRYAFGLDTNFYAAASVLVTWPLSIFYAPYYALGIAAAFAHLACALRRLPVGEGPSRQHLARGLLVAGMLVGLLIVATFSGAWYDILLPQAYHDMIEQFVPLVPQ